MKKNAFIPFIINLVFIVIILAISYAIFNITVFIGFTGLLLFLTPVLYGYLNKNNYSLTKLVSPLEIIVCSLFPIIILGFNNFIITTVRFKEIVALQITEQNVSIQEFNIITYVIGITIYLGIYYLAKKN